MSRFTLIKTIIDYLISRYDSNRKTKKEIIFQIEDLASEYKTVRKRREPTEAPANIATVWKTGKGSLG